MSHFSIKEGDTSPALVAFLTDNDDNPINLTEAVVRFQMAPRDDRSDLKVDADAVVTDGEDGEVTYNWASDDTDTVDTYVAEFEVTYVDDTEETFPNDAEIVVEVYDEVGP